jgi:multidrug efflux pump subunit AcrA (membrane-fusion protein)
MIMNKIIKRLKRINLNTPKFTKKIQPKKIPARTTVFIKRRPFTSFFIVLGIFLLIMILGNVVLSPKKTSELEVSVPKEVRTYKLGSAPKVTFQGKIEKSGVIKIVAQTPGIVSNINVSEGQEIAQGTNILSLSTNYQGGNAASVSRQITQTQYKNAKDSYPTQKDLIQKQKELADKNRENASSMQQIASSSASDSQNIINTNQALIDTLNSNLEDLVANNPGGINDSAILQTRQQIAQYQAANTQISASIRNLNLQANDTSKDVSSLQHDIAIKQLEIQEKALNMNLDISKLSYKLALINEATMYPSSPFAGKVERIFVHVGDNVNPGTVLASFSGDTQHVQIIVTVPEGIAKNISRLETSGINIGGKTLDLSPSYVSQDATDGVLYSVIFQLDDSIAHELTNLSYASVSLPIGTGNTTNEVPFIPLDSVTQTQEESFVYVVSDKNTAKALKINLGQVQGNYVEVTSGLPKESQVILDRNVIEGDKLKIIQ